MEQSHTYCTVGVDKCQSDVCHITPWLNDAVFFIILSQVYGYTVLVDRRFNIEVDVNLYGAKLEIPVYT